MQLPREDSTLKVFARIQGSVELPQLEAGWEKVLSQEEDGYAVSVWVEALDAR
jgi:hypothetical protein